MAQVSVEKHYGTKERILDPWIRLANLLSADEALPEPPVVSALPVPVSALSDSQHSPGWSGWLDLGRTQDVAATIEKVHYAWREQANALPSSGESADAQYEIFYRVRTTLRDIVTAISSPAFRRPDRAYETAYETAFGDKLRTFGTHPRKIVLVGSGVFLTEDFYGVFLRVLVKAGEEIYRLKFCPVCAAIFQPRRKDQRACAPRCANVLRVRDQRRYEKTRQGAKDRKQKNRRREPR
jgi:predicted nucleic acid-binding Zn ribbon protein